MLHKVQKVDPVRAGSGDLDDGVHRLPDQIDAKGDKGCKFHVEIVPSGEWTAGVGAFAPSASTNPSGTSGKVGPMCLAPCERASVRWLESGGWTSRPLAEVSNGAGISP
jgi:hypothetical protein